MIKRLREQWLRYEKERLNFSKNVKRVLFSSAFLGIVMSSFGASKTMAAEKNSTSQRIEYSTDQLLSDSVLGIDSVVSLEENIATSSVATSSNAKFSIGDEVYAKSGAKIWKDEYRLLDKNAGQKMKYPESVKKITGCVFLVNDCPRVVSNQEKVIDYQEQYELIGYLVNGIEGFLQAEDVYQLENVFDSVQTEETEQEVVSEAETVLSGEDVEKQNEANDSYELGWDKVTGIVIDGKVYDKNYEEIEEIIKNGGVFEGFYVVKQNEEVATPDSVIATPSNASIATPDSVIATPSNASIATPDSVIATASNASIATPDSVIATPSNVSTPSNIATPSNANGSLQIYRINEQISVLPTAKFYKSVKKFNQGKGAKKYPYELGWNKVTGIVVDGKVYHEKNAEKLVEAINNGGVIEGYEINHVRYLTPESIYQKDEIQISEEELKEKMAHVYPSDTVLTILPGSDIYSNEDDMRELKNGKSAYYPAGTEKTIFEYVLTDGEESFVVSDYDKVLEYVSIGYDCDGYLMINKYSKNIFGTFKSYEGFFKATDVVTKEYYDANLLNMEESIATPSNASLATPSNVATPSNTTIARSIVNTAKSEMDVNIARRMHLLELRENLRKMKYDESRNLTQNTVDQKLVRKL